MGMYSNIEGCIWVYMDMCFKQNGVHGCAL